MPIVWAMGRDDRIGPNGPSVTYRYNSRSVVKDGNGISVYVATAMGSFVVGITVANRKPSTQSPRRPPILQYERLVLTPTAQNT